jgi:ParB/RepB/Spo0J family partition protein
MAKKQTAAKPAVPPRDLENPILARLPLVNSVSISAPGIVFNPENPAKFRADFDQLRELVASIQQHGILQPLIVRQKTPGGPHELIAGERRLRAARHLGMLEVPALVYGPGEVDDARALEIALVENMHRRDQSPVDEAAAYALLRDRYGFTLADVAAQVGRPISHVHRRLVLTALAPVIADLLRAGWISTGAAEQFARLPDAKEQLEAIRRAWQSGAADCWGDDLEIDAILRGKKKPEERTILQPLGFADARNAVAEITRRLDGAPWDLADAALLPEAGACLSCPKRASAQETLFGADFGAPESEDSCMDSACWGRKAVAFSLAAIAKAKEIGAEVVSKKESARLYPNGTYLADHALLDVDRPCDLPGRRGSWRSVAKEILPDLELKVATDRDGGVHTLVGKKELIAAAKKSGLIKPEKVAARDSESARRANELAAAKAQKALADAVIDRALENEIGFEGPGNSREETIEHDLGLWEFLARGLLGRALHDSKRELARRHSRSLPEPMKAQDVSELLLAALADNVKADRGPRLRALRHLCLEVIAATGISGQDYGFECGDLGNFESDHGLGPAVEWLASFCEVDIGKVQKGLEDEKKKAAANKKPAAAVVKAKPARAKKAARGKAAKVKKSARGKAAKD